jgi:thioredoxin 1
MARKNSLWIVFGGMAVLLFAAFLLKGALNDLISVNMAKSTSEETLVSVKEIIDSNYNYSKNGMDYEYTLLEFGSTGCAVCKQMETEIGKVKASKSSKINVIFLNTNHPENQEFVKYFGISAIPMQVILDKTGAEFFKHYGFISAEELIKKTAQHKSN